MGTVAEPRPAELPLPGGRPGARVRLTPLLVARMIVPPALLFREEGRLAGLKAAGLRVPRKEWIEIPAIAFLVEHPKAGAILIDTAFHTAVSVDPKQGFGRFGGLIFKELEMRPEQSVAAQLRARGIDPGEVAIVVMTHLHSDHASGISEFPNSTFVVSDKEWEAASSGSQFEGYFQRQFDHAFDWRTLDFDGPDAESFAGFGRSFDLLGDSSIRLVFTPGHTKGHLSVILRLKEGEAFIAGDAIYAMRTLRDSHLPYRMADEHLFKRSLREIQAYTRETPQAVVIPGHDFEHWRTLKDGY